MNVNAHTVRKEAILIGWITLFAYISLIPFYYLQPVGFVLNHTTLTALKYLPLFFIFALSLMAFWHLLHRSASLPRTPIDLFVIAYLLVALISLIGASYPLEGALKFVYYTLTGIALLYLFTFQMRQTRDTIPHIVNAMVIIAAVVALYGILVFTANHDILWGTIYRKYNPYSSGASRLASSLGNAIYAGSYFALCLPLGLWTIHRHTQSDKRIFYGICTGLILIGELLTFARGGWVATAIAAAVYYSPQYKSVYHRIKKWLNPHRIIIGLIFLLAATAILEGIGFKEPMHRLANMLFQRIDRSSDLSDTESFRLAQYGTTYNVLKDHPLLGVGFGNFTRLFEHYKSPDTPRTLSATTENMLLMTACETGLLGLLAFFVLLVALLRTLFRIFKNAPEPHRNLLLACLAALSGFCFNMLTWDALNQPTVRITVWLITGIAFSIPNSFGDNREIVT